MSSSSKPPREPRPKHPFDEMIGPFYDAAGLTAHLSITLAELAALVGSGQVLETITGDGSRLYPTFQFKDNTVLPRLAEAIGAFDYSPVDGWSLALLLNAKEPAWGDRTAAELLRGDWADEVLHQLAFGERVPLDKRARFAAQYEIAEEVLRLLMPMIAHLPVRLDPASAIVGEGAEGYSAGVLVTDVSDPHSIKLLSFSLSSEPSTVAVTLASEVHRQVVAATTWRSDHRHAFDQLVSPDLDRYSERVELDRSLVGRRVKLVMFTAGDTREHVRVGVVEASRLSGAVVVDGVVFCAADGWSAFVEPV
jgi:hypothetical protein